MILSPNFTLAEMTVSETAARLGFDNTPDHEALAKLYMLADRLEQVRALLGVAIHITSGYRSDAVNKAVTNGRGGGHHPLGGAADFHAPGFGTPLAVARKILASDIQFGQLIHEYGRWVHFSILPVPNPVNRIITIDNQGTRPGLHEARQ